jgi:peptidoglycan/xylan/chitin deacetylase (PgdA/CDA1 family)
MTHLRLGPARLLLVAAPLLFALAGCAAGSPSVLPNRTATARAIAAMTAAAPTETPVPSPTPTFAPTFTNTPEPTATEPARPSSTPKPTATDRPEPPVSGDAESSQIFERGDGARSQVALTFDAGDDPGNTTTILDTLDEAGVKGTFGVTGEWAQANPDLVKRMVKEGHMLINHTWDHRSFTGESTSAAEGVLDSADRVDEVKETEKEIADLTGYDTAPYFRPPFGDYDDGVLADLASAGYTVTVMWSCDTLGWNGATVDEIMARCVDNAKAGDIILMHVSSTSADAAALPGMIEELQNQGFELVTVEEVLSPSS